MSSTNHNGNLVFFYFINLYHLFLSEAAFQMDNNSKKCQNTLIIYYIQPYKYMTDIHKSNVLTL